MRSCVSLALAALVIAMAPGASAVEPSRAITTHDQRVYGTDDGLPQSMVNALAQTPDGYLWVGTDGGLARFDGRSFTTFRSEDTPALRIHRVRTLLVDREGSLWIGTWGGAGLVRLRNGVFETFEDKIGRGGAVTQAFQDRTGALWFSNPGGLLKYDGKTFSFRNELGGVSLRDGLTMAEDGEGGLWIGTLTGLLRVANGRAERFSSASGASLTPTRAVISDRRGGLWIGAGAGGLFRYQDGKLSLVAPADPEIGFVSALLLDRHDVLWAATDGGLCRLRDGRLERVAPGSAVRTAAASLLEDHESSLWVGTQTDGLIRITHGPFRSLPKDELPGRRIASVSASRAGGLWIGSDGAGVVHHKDGVFTRVARPPGCTARVWAAVDDAAGRLWLGGERGLDAGLCRIDLASGQALAFRAEQGFSDRAVRALLLDPDGAVWVGTHDGLYRAEGDRVRLFHREGAGNFDVFALHRDRKGRLWAGVGGHRGGLHMYDGKGWTHFKDGLSNQAVFAIDEGEDGTLWLGTLSGFSRLRDGRVTGWRHPQGVFNDPVFKAIPDPEGNVWLCSPRGVFRVGHAALDAFDQRGTPLTHTRYGRNDGLASDQCDGGYGQHAGVMDAGGTLWFPSGKSVSALHPARVPTPVPTITPLIEAVRYDGGTVKLGGPLRLPPGRGDLEIAYTAPWLSQPERLRFRYRLVPFDSDWVNAGDRRVAFYTQVPPGAYTFQVTYEGGRAAQPVSLPLVIAPPFYITWWFRALVTLSLAALLSALLLLAHQRRVRMIEVQHQAVLAERTRIARDLHDTLAQGFTGISVQLEAATGWMDDAPERARENIDKARALVRASLADARRAVWDLRPEVVERGDLVFALSSMARNLSGNVAVRVQVNGRPRALPKAYETSLVRIGQEALTNAIRHAHASNIALTISFVNEGVHLKITDDGRGFDPEGKPGGPGHLGLEGIRSRARQLDAELTIESRKGAGTEVALWAPLPTLREGGTSDRSQPAHSNPGAGRS